MAMKGRPGQEGKGPRQEVKGAEPSQEMGVRGQRAEEDQRLLADDGGRNVKDKLAFHQKGKEKMDASKKISSFLSPAFLALIAANPPAVLGHYTVYMFLPAVSSHFLE